ncbi:PBP1A family penicillin-binding protein [Myxococcota bacterium]|nr:PBP1A family penicillin-binding protein [Myxococcota bacterium]
MVSTTGDGMSFLQSRTGRSLLILGGFALMAGGAAGYWFYDQFLRDLPDLRRIEDYSPALTSLVLDRNGRPIGEFYEEQRRLVPIGEIPRHVQLAFVAAEDKSFFEHEGLDYSSIARAALANLRGGGIRQGASTITQQMVKSLLLTPERTFRRKIREMILARRIEEHFTKDEILYLYVNQIYFGHGAWGIGQAARAYFGKEVPELTLSESALLAGLPQRPSAYSPYRDPEAAERRRQYVLERMWVDGFIDQASYEEALANPPEIGGPAEDENLEPAAHFVELVRRHLFEAIGSEAVLRGGLIIETTLDLDLQRAAVEALREGLEAHDKRQGYRGPLRTAEPDQFDEVIASLGERNSEFFMAAQTEEKTALGEEELLPLPPVSLPLETNLEGLVIEVEPKAQVARVAFAPGVTGVVHLQDVSWAGEPNPKRRVRAVQKIDSVFSTGDVARFVRIPGPASDSEADGGLNEARLTLYQEPTVQGALLSLENQTGDVLALVGGYDYAQSEFNRAVQAKRQPGSAFKPFIYGAALEKGYTPVSEVVDRPVVYTDPVSGFVWAPKNYGRKFYGPMPLRNALKKSINNATVHLFRDVGVNFVIDFSERLGIQSPLSPDLSLALGSSAVTLLELTQAYAVFPHQGRRVVPHFINQVTTPDGRILLGREPLGRGTEEGSTPELAESESVVQTTDFNEESTQPEAAEDSDRVISEASAYLMCDLLKAVVQEGTGRKARRLGRPVAGKTGTTNEQGDAWFMGFSPDITTGVWVGHDDNSLLGFGETGAGAALPIWTDFMEVALASRPVRDFDVPSENIVFARIDRKTGLLADTTSRDAYFQPFVQGTAPQRTVGQRESISDAARALRDDIF